MKSRNSAAAKGLVSTIRDVRPSTLARAPHVATGEVVASFGEEVARDLYAAFEQFNARFFDCGLGSPLVLITNAASSRTLGDYIARDVHGLESRIRIAPAAVKRGQFFAFDVLLHEMIHAWQQEIVGDRELGYRGHGPKFAAECTRIGALLGMPPVGVKGRDGLPDCAHWPMCVRPEGYYPEPYKPSKRAKKPAASPEPTTDDEADGARPDAFAALGRMLRKLTLEQLEGLGALVADEIRLRNN